VVGQHDASIPPKMRHILIKHCCKPAIAGANLMCGTRDACLAFVFLRKSLAAKAYIIVNHGTFPSLRQSIKHMNSVIVLQSKWSVVTKNPDNTLTDMQLYEFIQQHAC
jgi:hypothetical protein